MTKKKPRGVKMTPTTMSSALGISGVNIFPKIIGILSTKKNKIEGILYNSFPFGRSQIN